MTMPHFRTPLEMHEIYKILAKNAKNDDTYVLRYKAEKARQLTFFGVQHTYDTDSPIFDAMSRIWEQFIRASSHNKIVLCEGGVRPVATLSRDAAIKSEGDSGMACWLAYNANIEILSPEPDRKEEIALIVAEFGADKAVLYYFSRQMLQWARGDFMNRPNWRAYPDDLLQHYDNGMFPGIDLHTDSVLDIFHRVTGQPFNWQEIRQIEKLSSPFYNPVSAKSARLRDEAIFGTIQKYWQQDFNIFAVFGSGHAIVLEPALDTLSGARRV